MFSILFCLQIISSSFSKIILNCIIIRVVICIVFVIFVRLFRGGKPDCCIGFMTQHTAVNILWPSLLWKSKTPPLSLGQFAIDTRRNNISSTHWSSTIIILKPIWYLRSFGSSDNIRLYWLLCVSGESEACLYLLYVILSTPRDLSTMWSGSQAMEY